MKKHNFLVLIAFITLVPFILWQISYLVSYMILEPLGICHQYNGNNFGSSSLCIVPAISYFGYIFLSLIPLYGIARLLGLISLVLYFILNFLHNFRNKEQKQKYSRWAIGLIVAVALIQIISLFNSSLEKREYEEKKQQAYIPTENNFVCDEVIRVWIKEDDSVWVTSPWGDENQYLGSKRLGDVDRDRVVYINLFNKEEHDEALNTCVNDQGKTLFDIFEPEPNS